nr:hypothetical protein [Mobiluncus sp. Marseille-Q7826]
MSEQRPVPQQFPSRRQRREQQEPPAAPLSPAPGQPRAPQPPVAQPPGAQPYGAPPRVPQQSALPPQVVSQGVTSAVPPAGLQPLAEPSGAARPAIPQSNRPVPPGVPVRPAANPPVPGAVNPRSLARHTSPCRAQRIIKSPARQTRQSPLLPRFLPAPGRLDTTRKPRAHPW